MRMCDRFIYAVGQATNSNVGSVKEMLRINPDGYRDGCLFPRPYRTAPARMIRSGGRSGGFAALFCRSKRKQRMVRRPTATR